MVLYDSNMDMNQGLIVHFEAHRSWCLQRQTAVDCLDDNDEAVYLTAASDANMCRRQHLHSLNGTDCFVHVNRRALAR